jgi:Uma2 family endonuclease
VAEYWIVDLDARLVECWTPADERPQVLTERLDWRPLVEQSPRLSIDLIALFRDVLDD